jgi:uncharacterized membrane protein YeaQ/YmgE (transglycosylase-associated protein family)
MSANKLRAILTHRRAKGQVEQIAIVRSSLVHSPLPRHNRRVCPQTIRKNRMTITIGQIIVWIVVGLLMGSLVGRLATKRKKGYGLPGNLALGVVGAIVGGLIFDVLQIDFALGELAITFEDLIAAFVGALLVLFTLRLLRR